MNYNHSTKKERSDLRALKKCKKMNCKKFKKKFTQTLNDQHTH